MSITDSSEAQVKSTSEVGGGGWGKVNRPAEAKLLLSKECLTWFNQSQCAKALPFCKISQL